MNQRVVKELSFKLLALSNSPRLTCEHSYSFDQNLDEFFAIRMKNVRVSLPSNKSRKTPALIQVHEIKAIKQFLDCTRAGN